MWDTLRAAADLAASLDRETDTRLSPVLLLGKPSAKGRSALAGFQTNDTMGYRGTDNNFRHYQAAQRPWKFLYFGNRCCKVTDRRNEQRSVKSTLKCPTQQLGSGVRIGHFFVGLGKDVATSPTFDTVVLIMPIINKEIVERFQGFNKGELLFLFIWRERDARGEMVGADEELIGI